MRAMTYDQAVEAGLEPQEYDYEAPEGEYEAVLDFKVWGKSVNLQCFFTALDTDDMFRISAFRGNTTRYTPKDGGIDFSEPGNEGNTYRLRVGRNSKGNVAWLAATLVDE